MAQLNISNSSDKVVNATKIIYSILNVLQACGANRLLCKIDKTN